MGIPTREELKGLSDTEFAAFTELVNSVQTERADAARKRDEARVRRRIAFLEKQLGGSKRCKHNNVQTYTEWCLSCHHNIYDYDDTVYLQDLEKAYAKVKAEAKSQPKGQKCAHRSVQQFTEICLDCGKNIYAA